MMSHCTVLQQQKALVHMGHNALHELWHRSGASMLDNWQACLKKSAYFAPFSGKQESAIKLVLHLRRTEASVDTCESLMRWHLETVGRLHPRESTCTSPHFMSREKLHKELKIRCNRDTGYGNITKIILLSAKTKAKILGNESKMVIQLLLTELRAMPEHHLWFDDDSFAPPPTAQDHISDLDADRSHRETHKKPITKPGEQILCPVPLCLDGAATGQFVNNPSLQSKLPLAFTHKKPVNRGYFGAPLDAFLAPPRSNQKVSTS